jgi:hypothetical protein
MLQKEGTLNSVVEVFVRRMKNSLALVRERQPLVGEVSANFCG